MAENRGKKFEKRFLIDWLRSFPDSFIHRLPDQQSGYFGTSRNPCDFIGFEECVLYLLECKSIKGNTFPLTNLKQYNILSKIKPIHNLRRGVIIWFYSHNKVIYIPIQEITKMLKDNKKSVNIKMLDENVYKIIDIPSKLIRTFMQSDYSILKTLKDGD